MLCRCGEGEPCSVCTGVESNGLRAADEFALHSVSSSPLTEQLCKPKGRESGRVLGWGLRDVHTLEGTEGSRARRSGCGSDAGKRMSLCYPHRKQKQNTVGCGMHVGTQWEPTPGSTRKAGQECSPAQLNYFREGTARGAARDKTDIAPDSSLRTRRLPILERHRGQTHLQQALSVSSGRLWGQGAGAGWDGGRWGSVRGRSGARGACAPLQKGRLSLF